MAACCDRVPKPAALRNYIVLGEEVKKALAMKRPIVALESTGMLLSMLFSRISRTVIKRRNFFY